MIGFQVQTVFCTSTKPLQVETAKYPCVNMKTHVVTQKSVLRPFAGCSETFVRPEQDVKQMSVKTTQHTIQQDPESQVMVQEKGRDSGLSQDTATTLKKRDFHKGSILGQLSQTGHESSLVPMTFQKCPKGPYGHGMLCTECTLPTGTRSNNRPNDGGKHGSIQDAISASPPKWGNCSFESNTKSRIWLDTGSSKNHIRRQHKGHDNDGSRIMVHQKRHTIPKKDGSVRVIYI